MHIKDLKTLIPADPMLNYPHSKPVDTHLNKQLFKSISKPPGRMTPCLNWTITSLYCLALNLRRMVYTVCFHSNKCTLIIPSKGVNASVHIL